MSGQMLVGLGGASVRSFPFGDRAPRGRAVEACANTGSGSMATDIWNAWDSAAAGIRCAHLSRSANIRALAGLQALDAALSREAREPNSSSGWLLCKPCPDAALAIHKALRCGASVSTSRRLLPCPAPPITSWRRRAENANAHKTRSF